MSPFLTTYADSGSSPLAKHHPTVTRFAAESRRIPTACVPRALLTRVTGIDLPVDDTGEWSEDVLEWLGLVTLGSPRVQAGDKIDPYLCRPTLPEGTPQDVLSIQIRRWKGMVDSSWVTQLLISCL